MNIHKLFEWILSRLSSSSSTFVSTFPDQYLISCGGDDSSDNGPDIDGRQWTYMVYLGADNNLSSAGIGDIEETPPSCDRYERDRAFTKAVPLEYQKDCLCKVIDCPYTCDAPNFFDFFCKL
jgi:hypothetical protein